MLTNQGREQERGMGGKDKEVKKRDLGPKGERVKYLHGGGKSRDSIWAGLREGADSNRVGGKGPFR